MWRGVGVFVWSSIALGYLFEVDCCCASHIPSVLNLFCGFRVLFGLWCVGVCFRWLGWTGRRDVGLWDSSVCVCVFLWGQLQDVSARFLFLYLF